MGAIRYCGVGVSRDVQSMGRGWLIAFRWGACLTRLCHAVHATAGIVVGVIILLGFVNGGRGTIRLPQVVSIPTAYRSSALAKDKS